MKVSFNVGVVGDAMIDEYYSVRIKGISPEFPIPSMHSFDSTPSTIRPGGAANVINQFLHFSNINSWLISFLNDYSKRCFSENSINVDFCRDINSCIPIKRRFYSDGFPTYRWDVEKENYGLGADIQLHCLELYNSFFSNISKFDAVIFSDYGKGVFFPNNFHYVPKDIITVVDSKSKDLDKWFGCTVFKPNLKEAIEISGKSNAVDAGIWIRSRIKSDHVVITNADKGVTIVSKDGIEQITPLNPPQQATSVIGAGDCFTAVLTLSLLEGMNIKEAAFRAWEAGQVYVQNKYNYPITPLDLLKGKFVSDPLLLRNRNFKLVFTNGCFDLIHNGHIQNLKFAKSKGDKLVVALNDDSSVARLKPNRPVQSLADRIQILSSIEHIDYLVSFSEDTPLELISNIAPDVLVKGDEYDFNEIVGSDIVKEVFVFPMVCGCSTTNLIRKMVESFSLS
jgi:D-beta-D-heptose 7-phosphate kinase/D-beta-D-heptose 1-phosphate adenosyltransferase